MSGITIFLIVLLAMVVGVIDLVLKHREKMAARRHTDDSGAMADRVAALESRVRTLERIVTDRGYALKDEIESL